MRLVVLGCEVGGRWAPEALALVSCLAAHKTEEAPELLRRSASLAWHRRWSTMLSVAAQRALAEPLLAPGSPHLSEVVVAEPPLGELLAGPIAADPAGPSRLPLR